MIDLAIFCGKNGDERLATPWSAGDWTFATNGLILVRVPRRDGVMESIDAPNVIGTTLWDIFEKDPASWQSIPDVSVKQEVCPSCKGAGKVYACPECDGSGEVIPYTEYNEYDEQTCLTCDGAGQLKKEDWLSMFRGRLTDTDADCNNCSGTGKVWNDKSIQIGGALFCDRFISMVGTLPNAEIGVFGKHDAARFRFDGGDGILMPRHE